jgi:hypothetical protein
MLPLHKKPPTQSAKNKAEYGQMSTATTDALYGSAGPAEWPKPAQRARPSKRQQLETEEALLKLEKDIVDQRLAEITEELAVLPA